MLVLDLFMVYIDYHYETVAVLMHAEHMEAVSGVGPHTISFPRLLPAEGVDYSDFPYLVTDRELKKIVAVIRLAVPYTGMILSTRETAEFRQRAFGGWDFPNERRILCRSWWICKKKGRR